MSREELPDDFTSTEVIESRLQEWSKHVNSSNTSEEPDNDIFDDHQKNNNPSKKNKGKSNKKKKGLSNDNGKNVGIIGSLFNLLKKNYLQAILLFILLFTVLSLNIKLPLQFLSFLPIPLEKLSILTISLISTMVFIGINSCIT